MKIAVSKEQARFLIENEPRFAPVIERAGLLVRGTDGDDFFSDLLGSIVSQQLSGRVAEVIWGRFKGLFSDFSPAAVASADIEYIKSAGLSTRKAEYIKGAAEAVLTGLLEMNRFPDLADEDIIEELVKLRGIGRWTAEMLLIFTLGRQNVLSVGDLGIKNGLKLLYGDNPDCEAIKAKFSPHLTALSLYLWEIAGNPKAYFSQE